MALCNPTKEAPLDGEAVRRVPWPIPFERLVKEIEALLETRLPPGYRLDRSDPEVLTLRSPQGAVVARFSVRGYVAESIERQVSRADLPVKESLEVGAVPG
jgi:hypothetical protein